MSEIFDDVVVGGGSAGCVAAGVLAEAGRRVLVLEAGPAAEDHPETLHADGYKDAFINDEVFWDRFTAPQRASAGQRFFAGTGKVLGGSGSVNGMVYTRGDRRDYDAFPTGWQWDDVVPDFKAIEARLRPRRRGPTRFTEAAISAAEARGFRRSDDLNDGDLGGVIGYEWMNYEGDRRRSSYVAFIQEPGPRDNLTVRTRALVHSLDVVRDGDGPARARAVVYEHDGRLLRAQVRGEVLLAAGALVSPKILMLSGVGPGQALRALGITPTVEVEGVGRNLHDHPNVPLFYLSRERVDAYYPQLYSFFRTNPTLPLPPGQSDTCYIFWPAPSAMKQAVQRMLPGKILPPALYHGPLRAAVRAAVGGAFALPGAAKAVDHLFGVVVILGKPESRGSLRLASADPRAEAIIDPAYFSDARDMETMIRGVKLARQLAHSGALEAWTRAELMPGPLVRRDDAIARFVEKNAITTYHFAGTCRMGTREQDPADPRLRVRGLANVRIADASAIPTTPVSALNAPSMLVGYRAARYLLQDAQT